MTSKTVTVREYGENYALRKETITEIRDCDEGPEDARESVITRVGEFEKVSLEQFENAMREVNIRLDEDKLIEMYKCIETPKRSTSGSAGYDFALPFDLALYPGDTIKIPTGIRVRIDDGWWLGCLPRSGLGFKYRLQLDNTMGVIDSDYYNSDNEGHIFAKITYDREDGDVVTLNAGDKFMQAIFIPYGITNSDEADGARNGGLGSTGR